MERSRLTDPGQQQGKLVTPQARDCVGCPHHFAHSVGHRTQHRIARRVPRGIVDLLEVVEVDLYDAEGRALPFGGQPRLLEAVTEEYPVG